MQKDQRQDFDSPWKEALDVYFPEFMNFFFRNIHAAVDWSRGYTFLDKEFQKITRDAATGRRHVDKLVRIFLNSGGETWLLIHVEIKASLTRTSRNGCLSIITAFLTAITKTRSVWEC